MAFFILFFIETKMTKVSYLLLLSRRHQILSKTALNSSQALLQTFGTDTFFGHKNDNHLHFYGALSRNSALYSQ